MTAGDYPVALVTGAARGIGAATALEFARRGFDVALTDVLAGPLAGVADQVRDIGRRAFVRAGDLADLGFAERLVAEVAGEFGRVDVLVNNAAWRELVTMREVTAESWDKTLRVCLTAPAFLARWAAGHMERRGRGVVVNVTSVMARQSWGMAPAYVAAKAGLDALTRDLAALYGPSGVRVVAVSPGAIQTDLSITGGQGAAVPPGVARDVREWSEGMIPLRRWGTPEEVARAIAFVAGEDASYVNGATLVVDGGWSRNSYPHALKRAMRPDQFP